MSIFRRKPTTDYGMDERDADALGRYNAECARGIVHTPEWADRTATLQRRFNEAQEVRWAADPKVIVVRRTEP